MIAKMLTGSIHDFIEDYKVVHFIDQELTMIDPCSHILNDLFGTSKTVRERYHSLPNLEHLVCLALGTNHSYHLITKRKPRNRPELENIKKSILNLKKVTEQCNSLKLVIPLSLLDTAQFMEFDDIRKEFEIIFEDTDTELVFLI